MTLEPTAADYLEAARRIKRTFRYRWVCWRKGVVLEDDWVADMIAQHCCSAVSSHAADHGSDAVAEESADMAWRVGYCGRKGTAYGIDPLTVLAIFKVVVRLWLWWRSKQADA